MASTMEDYGSELQELQWGSGDRSGHLLRNNTHFLRPGAGSSYEAEDLELSSQHHRHSIGEGEQHRGYYSPPGTSYTIVERLPSMQHHHSTLTTPYRFRKQASASGGTISREQVLR
jgi:hypothetical protein